MEGESRDVALFVTPWKRRRTIETNEDQEVDGHQTVVEVAVAAVIAEATGAAVKAETEACEINLLPEEVRKSGKPAKTKTMSRTL
jgi:hypothetical protein